MVGAGLTKFRASAVTNGLVSRSLLNSNRNKVGRPARLHFPIVVYLLDLDIMIVFI